MMSLMVEEITRLYKDVKKYIGNRETDSGESGDYIKQSLSLNFLLSKGLRFLLTPSLEN